MEATPPQPRVYVVGDDVRDAGPALDVVHAACRSSERAPLAASVAVAVGWSPPTVRAARAEIDGRLLVLVASADRSSVAAMLEAGADGVCLWTESESVISWSIGIVSAGYAVAPSAAGRSLARPVFTARQKQILALLVLGLSNAEIASRLFIAEVTVKTHLTLVFSKLGVKSRTEAIDLILDPASGLGTGILGLGDAERTQKGYGRPTVT